MAPPELTRQCLPRVPGARGVQLNFCGGLIGSPRRPDNRPERPDRRIEGADVLLERSQEVSVPRSQTPCRRCAGWAARRPPPPAPRSVPDRCRGRRRSPRSTCARHVCRGQAGLAHAGQRHVLDGAAGAGFSTSCSCMDRVARWEAAAATCWALLAVVHLSGKSSRKRSGGCRNVLSRKMPCSGLSP